MSYRVAVRALCEFTAKRGDLDLRFTPSPTALEGIAGHQEVAGRRGAGYQTEVPLSGDHRNLRVSGRADGYSAALGQVDEVKTYRGDLDLMPDNHRDLHWAQARIYGHLICQRDGLSEIRVALVYFNVVTQKERVLVEVVTADELRTDFEQQCDLFIDWAEQELMHRGGRDRTLAALSFPHTDFRTGQRPLAEAAYKTAAVGSALMAQAPTGIGKTIGTLFPLLKAMPGQGLDKVFFLTAKTPGRRLALDAARRLNEQADPEPIRVLELIARDKACEHPDKACHGESCPLARGFYDRLPAARQAAANAGWLDQLSLREIARAHEICPYYLSQEMARWSDLVVADYNYYFDLSAMLYALTRGNDWRVAVLADEAHNLVARARGMYSAELDQRRLRAIRRTAPAALKKPLNGLHRHWNDLSAPAGGPLPDPDYEVRPLIPSSFLASLQRTVAAMTDHFTEHPFAIDSDLLRFYFDLV
ncbi:MAG: ATP-dependent DNA helicase, partial [Marinobacter sp.]|nr:ATP-dependent DNA helicase [Marinobacter sp.]